jgi:hypothetical protein
MNSLYQFINSAFATGLTLSDIKPLFSSYFNEEVVNYCIGMSNYSSGKYNRIKLFDYSNDSFELILICWDSNSESRIHDHPHNGCVLHLMSGTLEEHLYDHSIKLSQITKINQGDTSYMDNLLGYHKIKCIDKAMSLHLYSPVNHKMKIFEE